MSCLTVSAVPLQRLRAGLSERHETDVADDHGMALGRRERVTQETPILTMTLFFTSSVYRGWKPDH